MTGIRRALIVMAKQPRPGATKTRLVPRLTPEQAVALYECCLLDMLDLARGVPDVQTLIAVSPPESEGYFTEIAPDLAQLVQIGTSLGERLDSVLTQGLAMGFDQVVAIGSDVPSLPSAHLTMAFAALGEDAVDIVLGPSEDGGYHLIGWEHPHPDLVRGVVMSTPSVLVDTLKIAESANLGVRLLPSWWDLDEPADLDRLIADVKAEVAMGDRVRSFVQAMR